MVLLWLFVIVGAVFLLYAVTRLVLANPRLLQLQDGQKSRWDELLLPLLGLAALLLSAATPAMKKAIPQFYFGMLGLLALACSVALFRGLFCGLRPRIAATICASLVIAAWWIWPSWLTVDVFAAIAVCVILSAILLFGAKFRHTVLIAAFFMVRDFMGVIATRQAVQATESATAQARPQPTHFLVPVHWQLDLNYLFALGVVDVAIPGAMIVVAGVYGYRHGGRWAILAGGLIGYAVGLTAGVVVNYVTRAPQAGLLYICTSVATGIALVAWRQGQLRNLWQAGLPAKVAS